MIDYMVNTDSQLKFLGQVRLKLSAANFYSFDVMEYLFSLFPENWKCYFRNYDYTLELITEPGESITSIDKILSDAIEQCYKKFNSRLYNIVGGSEENFIKKITECNKSLMFNLVQINPIAYLIRF